MDEVNRSVSEPTIGSGLEEGPRASSTVVDADRFP